MLTRTLTATLTVSLVWMLLINTACSESVHTKQIPTKTLELLEKKFMMSEVLTIAKTKSDLKSVTAYFNANTKLYKYVAQQEQGDMNVEAYSVKDLSLPIIGYSLFFYKISDSLMIIDTSVNPLNKEAVQNITQLIKQSFDSVVAEDGSKLYFLGIYDLDSKRLLKIMLREAKTSIGPDYAIRYAISSK
jgi:hypothetical protein